MRLRVPVIVEIGRRTMSLSEVLTLGPGAIIELDKSADDDLTMRVSNMPVGGGEAIKVGENFGMRINDIVSAADRVKAMGG